MPSMAMVAYPALAGLLYDVERETEEIKLDGEGRPALRQAKSVQIISQNRARAWEEAGRKIRADPLRDYSQPSSRSRLR